MPKTPFEPGKPSIEQILVAGLPAPFFFDPVQGLAHGQVTFTSAPLKIEVRCSPGNANRLPEKPVTPDLLALQPALSSK